MTDSEPDWLPDACARWWAAPPADRRGLATDLGAHAASSSMSLQDLVVGMLQAGAGRWDDGPYRGESADTVHAQAGALLSDLGDLVAAAIDGYHQAIDAEWPQTDAGRADFVRELLTGRTDPARLAERAHRYGIRIAGTHTVTVVRTEHLTDNTLAGIDDALAARFGAGNTLISRHQGHLVCVSAGGLRGVPAELAHHLRRHLPTGGWQIGVGRPHPATAGIVTSLGEARDALDLATRLGFTSPILHAADLLVFPVLLRDRDAITDLVDTVLGPLRTARGGPDPYLETLTVLFDNQGNYTATARALHLSVRAVTYRLNRIRTLTGYHPSEPTQRFTLHAAVLGAKLLNWPEPQPADRQPPDRQSQ